MSKVKMVKSVEEYNTAIAGSGLGMLWREKQCFEPSFTSSWMLF